MKYRILLLAVMIFTIAVNLSAQIANHVVISEVYGGGGNSGSTWKNDFIELYNPTTLPISINGWSVQYASATGTTWQVTNISGTIAPHGFFLIQESQGTGGTTNLPTPDATGSISMSSTVGKVALCNATAPLTGDKPTDASIIDFVGFGSTASWFEGTGPTPAPSNTTSIERKASSASTAASLSGTGLEVNMGNGYDTDNNANDFVAQSTINPQNSSSPAEPALSVGDVTPPSVISMKVLASTQIEVLFNEPVDSLSSSTSSNYTMTKSIIVSNAQRDISNIKRVVLTVSTMANDIYTLTIKNIKDTVGNAMTTPASFQFSVGVLTIAQAHAAGAGVNVRVRGIITVANEFTSPSYMQDSTGGLAVYNTKFSTSVKLGDIWEVAGVLSNYYGLMEMNPLTDSVKISSGNPLPTPKLLHSSGLSETEESELVRVNRVKFAAYGNFATGVDSNYAAGDAYGPMQVYISKYSNVPGSQIPTDSVNIVGVVNQHNDVYSVLLRTLADINVIDPPSSQTWLDINIARSHATGDMVKVRGVVTYAQPSKTTGVMTIFLQDFSGGIAVYDPKSDTLQLGDSVEVKGVLYDYSGLLELSPVDSVRLLVRGVPLPTPDVITLAQASEAYESQLVKLYGVRFTTSGTFSGGTSGTTYSITDGVNQLQVFIPFGSALAGVLIPAGLLDIVGVISQHTAYQLIPRSSNDLFGYPGPQISSLPALTSVTDTSFTVNWVTFFRGSSNVYYGMTKNLGDSVVVSSLDSLHSVTVSRLKPGRIYYYKAASMNGAGTSASFITPLVTMSPASTGQMNLYFNYSIDASYGLTPLANGNTDLLSKLLERIHNATKSIDMAIYSYDDFSGTSVIVSDRISDSLLAAYSRGVKIRVVFDNKSTTTPLSRLIAAGIPVVKRSIPGTDNGIMHNKFFIFDGRDTTSATDDWVLTGSWNVTNTGTVSDAQDAIFIQDQSLARIYTIEFEEMFGSSTEVPNLALAAFGPMKQDNTPHFTTIAGKKVEVYFSPSDHTTTYIINALATANKNIFFGVLAFTRDDIAQKLIERKNASVIVRGLIDQQPSVLGTLQTAGVDALQAGHSVVTGLFHHKYGVVDPFNNDSDPLVIMGSHNWSSAAEQDNDENTLIIHSGEIARQYVQEFAARYKESGGEGPITSVSNISSIVPVHFNVSQNYPNPFNPTTTFQFQIPLTGLVTIKVYDILGREVMTLLDEVKPAGIYQINWNASALTTGVYFYKMQAGTFNAVKKAILLK
jgi:phosphatidylserine/phosphatidylglycerophosphate/cardiolipin synthase-like enzyme/predicted extracellular nuclease